MIINDYWARYLKRKVSCILDRIFCGCNGYIATGHFDKIYLGGAFEFGQNV